MSESRTWEMPFLDDKRLVLIRSEVSTGKLMFCLAQEREGDMVFLPKHLPRLIAMLQEAYRETNATMARP